MAYVPFGIALTMRMICNDLVKQSKKACDGAAIFEAEPQEALDKINVAKETALRLQADFFEYKRIATDSCPDSPWNIPTGLVFGRLDIFSERLKDVTTVIQTMQQYARLEKVEIGGTSGKLLTASIQYIYTEFLEISKMFQGITYDPFDIESSEFEESNDKFMKWVDEMDLQIASVVAQGLEDAISIELSFKLLDSFDKCGVQSTS